MNTSAKILIVALLATLAFAETLAHLRRVVAVDFYQLWAVSAARRLSPSPLGSPYTRVREYGEVLNRQADASPDARLRAANRLWRGLSPVVPPLMYLAFSVFPADYPVAVSAYAWLQVLLFLGSLGLLGWVCRLSPFLLLCLACILLRSYEPFLSNVRVGNVSVGQLFGLAALLAVAERLRRTGGAERGPGTVFLAGLSLLTLLKPNVGLITLLMAAAFWATHGSRLFLRCAIGAAGASFAFLLLPAAYFGSPGIWLEWYRHVFVPGKWVVGRSVEQGNYSTVAIMAERLGADATITAIVIGAGLVASLLLTAALGARAGGAGPGAAWRRVADTSRATSIGTIATVAMAPLVWLHYDVLLLVPIFWLARNGVASAVGALCAAGLVMASGALNIFLFLGGLEPLVPVVFALSWVPLWAAMLLDLARERGVGAQRA